MVRQPRPSLTSRLAGVRSSATTRDPRARTTATALADTADEEVKDKATTENVSVEEVRELAMIREMAEISLSDSPRLGKDDPPRLPYDMYGEIARALVADGAYKTAARLNQTCRAVHEETLPILYETMIVYDAELFERSIGETDSKGFKHVKYLIATPKIMKLIADHISKSRQLSTSTCSHGFSTDRTGAEDGFCEAFPRLVFFSMMSPTITEGCLVATAPVVVCVYAYLAVTFGTILDRLSADKITNGIGFFGVQLSRYNVKFSAKANRAQHIELIGFKEGACLVPPVDGRDVNVDRDAVAVVDVGSRRMYRFYDDGDNPDPRVRGALDLVMDCATYGRESGRDRNHACNLRLRRGALSILIESIKARPSSTVPTLDIQVMSSFPMQTHEMKQHLLSLAIAYTQGWIHRAGQHGDEFLKIFTSIPVPAHVSFYSNVEGKLVGVFKYGAGRGTREEEFAGFSVTLLSGYQSASQNGSRTVGNYRTIAEVHYPCPGVPFEMPPGVNLRQAPPVLRQARHIPADVQALARRLQFVLGVERTNGNLAWDDGSGEENEVGADRPEGAGVSRIEFRR